jgi:hypothetical protein
LKKKVEHRAFRSSGENTFYKKIPNFFWPRPLSISHKKKKFEKPKLTLRPFFIVGDKNSQKKIPNFVWLPPTFEEAKMLGFH